MRSTVSRSCVRGLRTGQRLRPVDLHQHRGRWAPASAGRRPGRRRPASPAARRRSPRRATRCAAGRRPASAGVTSPIAVASTPQRAQIDSTTGRFSGVTTSSIRSCDSDASTSCGAHRRLAQRDQVEVDRHAGAGRRGGLRQRAGQPGAAQVLDADDQVEVVDLQACLDEQLLQERVADLHARPARARCPASKRGAGEHRDAADAVAAGLGPDEHHDVARPGRRLAAAAGPPAARRRRAR